MEGCDRASLLPSHAPSIPRPPHRVTALSTSSATVNVGPGAHLLASPALPTRPAQRAPEDRLPPICPIARCSASPLWCVGTAGQHPRARDDTQLAGSGRGNRKDLSGGNKQEQPGCAPC